MGRNSFNGAKHDGARLAKQQAAQWSRKDPFPKHKRNTRMPTLDEEARAARAVALNAAAKTARMTDADLMKLAKPYFTPEEAIADIRARYPAGFEAEPIKRFTEMTDAERAEFARKHGLKLERSR